MPPYIQTSQLICCANPLIGFHMGATLAFNGLSTKLSSTNQIQKKGEKLQKKKSWNSTIEIQLLRRDLLYRREQS